MDSRLSSGIGKTSSQIESAKILLFHEHWESFPCEIQFQCNFLNNYFKHTFTLLSNYHTDKRKIRTLLAVDLIKVFIGFS